MSASQKMEWYNKNSTHFGMFFQRSVTMLTFGNLNDRISQNSMNNNCFMNLYYVQTSVSGSVYALISTSHFSLLAINIGKQWSVKCNTERFQVIDRIGRQQIDRIGNIDLLLVVRVNHTFLLFTFDFNRHNNMCIRFRLTRAPR